MSANLYVPTKRIVDITSQVAQASAYFTNFGSGYAPFRALLIDNTRVQLEGLLNPTQSIAASTSLFANLPLPNGGIHIFDCPAGVTGSFARFDILASGTMVCGVPLGVNAWFSMAAVSYVVAGA